MYYFLKSLVRGVKRRLGMRTFPPGRYQAMLEEIDRLQPRTILEIGTNDGVNASYLCRRAFRHRGDVEYFGFDLFEQMDDATFVREFTLATPSLQAVDRFLGRSGVKRRRLVAGNTHQTLAAEKSRLPRMDLVFIDGGHSEETVASDWANVQDLLHANSVVFFDDYPNFGIGNVIAAIDHRRWNVNVLPTEDLYPVNPRFRKSGDAATMSVKLVRVTPVAGAVA